MVLRIGISFFPGLVGRPENLSGRRVSAVKPTCPISPTPCLCATPFPAAFRRQYTHHGTGINPKSMHTSDVETEGVDGESPAPGLSTAVRSPGTGRGGNLPTSVETALGVSVGRNAARCDGGS